MKRILFGLAVLGFAAGFAHAEFNSGDNEIAFFGNYTNIKSDDGDHAETAFAFANVGHFFTDEIELGLIGMGRWSDTVDVYSAGVNGRYHFMTDSPLVPYLGAFGMFGYAENNGSDNGWIYGPLAGLRFFVNETTNVFVEYQYQLYEGDLGDNIDNEQLILAGISFKF
jgi:hypothetical protein